MKKWLLATIILTRSLISESFLRSFGAIVEMTFEETELNIK